MYSGSDQGEATLFFEEHLLSALVPQHFSQSWLLLVLSGQKMS